MKIGVVEFHAASRCCIKPKASSLFRSPQAPGPGKLVRWPYSALILWSLRMVISCNFWYLCLRMLPLFIEHILSVTKHAKRQMCVFWVRLAWEFRWTTFPAADARWVVSLVEKSAMKHDEAIWVEKICPNPTIYCIYIFLRRIFMYISLSWFLQLFIGQWGLPLETKQVCRNPGGFGRRSANARRRLRR